MGGWWPDLFQPAPSPLQCLQAHGLCLPVAGGTQSTRVGTGQRGQIPQAPRTEQNSPSPLLPRVALTSGLPSSVGVPGSLHRPRCPSLPPLYPGSLIATPSSPHVPALPPAGGSSLLSGCACQALSPIILWSHGCPSSFLNDILGTLLMSVYHTCFCAKLLAIRACVRADPSFWDLHVAP